MATSWRDHAWMELGLNTDAASRLFDAHRQLTSP